MTNDPTTKRIHALPAAWLVAGLLLLTGCARSRQPNILLVTLDTTRADHIGAYGAQAAYTPNLDRLAADGWLFENARTVCPLTLPAHASIMTGVTPLRHGLRVNDGGILPTTVPTLAELFRANGYATAAFVSAVVLDKRFGLNRGFDHYDDRLPMQLYGAAAEADPAAAGAPPSIDGAETTTRMLSWLEQRKQPWFAWVHYYDPHVPYHPHAEYERQGVTNAYSQEIAHMDAQFGRILAELQRRRQYRDTWIIAVGDHGESLGEHGEATHGMTIYDGTMRVPLIVKPGGRQHGRSRRETRIVSSVDIAPTLAAVIGAPWQVTDTAGGAQPLSTAPAADATRLVYLETLNPEIEFGWAPQAGLAGAQWKFIESPRAELYELTRDPREEDNRVLRDDDVAERLADELDGRRQNVPREQPGQAPLDAATLERLRSLGYTAGGGAERRAAATRPASTNDARRDIKDALPLVNEYHQLKGIFTSGLWTTEDYLRMHALCARAPETPNFHLLLAKMAGSVGDRSLADRSYHRAIELRSDDFDLIDSYGSYLLLEGRFDEARVQFVRALELGGGVAGQPLIAARLAHIELGAGNPAVATNLLTEAFPLIEEKRGLWKRLGDGRNLLGDPVGALECYRQALSELPNWVSALEGKAWTAACTGSDEARLEALADAHVLCQTSDHREPRDLETMAVAYAGNGRFPRAIETAEQARALIRQAATGDVARAVLRQSEPAAGEHLKDRWKRSLDRGPFYELLDARLVRHLEAWCTDTRPTAAELRERLAARDYLLDEPARQEPSSE